MSLITHAFDLDITPGAIPLVIHVSEGDIGRSYEVTIKNGGGDLTIPSGTTAKVEGTVGTNAFSEAATVDGNVVSFQLTENMTATAGKAWTKIELSKDDEPVQTCAFILDVDPKGAEADTVINMAGFHAEIKAALTEYLEENNIVIDDTLSTAGAAAEASTVGDKLAKSLHMKNLIANTAPATMAELEAHSYSWCSPSWFSDAPATTSSGWAVTIPSKVSGTPAYATQLYIVPDDVCFYVRRFASGAWGSWSKSVAPSDLNSYVARNGSVATAYGNDASANSVLTRGLWYVPKGNAYSFTDFPVDEPMQMQVFVNGTVLTQVVVGMQSGGVYTRYKVGSNNFGKWHTSVDTKRDPDAVYYAFGDSVVKGQVGGVSGVTSKHNYPACVGRLLGMQVQNKGVSNQGLVKDWSTINTTIENLDMSDAALITVGWAYNDGGRYASNNYGAYTDTADSTVLGKYYSIMKKLQTKCPNAQVMLVTGYGFAGGTVDPYQQATLTEQFTHVYTFNDGTHTVGEIYDDLERMCNLHGWPCINQHHGCAFNEFNATALIGDQIHPTDAGYMRYGNHLAARIAANYANLATF